MEPKPQQVGNSIGKGVPPGWYTRALAAEQVQRSPDTLRTWHKQGVYEPSGWMPRGALKVWLYSDEDVHCLKQIAARMPRGRRRKKRED